MCQCLIKEKEIILRHTQLCEYHMISQISVWSFSKLNILPIPGMKISKISPQALVWLSGAGAIQARGHYAHSRTRHGVVTGTYSCPLALHSPPHWVTSTSCHTGKARMIYATSPQEVQGPDEVHGHSHCCYSASSDPLDSPKEAASPHTWGPALLLLAHCCFSSVGPCNSWVLRDDSLSTCCQEPNWGHLRKKRPTHLTFHISMFFALWPRSLGLPRGPSLLEILQSACPIVVCSIQCPTTKIFWQKLQKTSGVNNIFSWFPCSIFAQKVAPELNHNRKGTTQDWALYMLDLIM